MDGIRKRIELNRRELALGLTDSGSWHSQYSHSAYVYIGGFPPEVSEGDLLCILSQYGEIVDLDLVRDKDSGKSKGFAFAAYEDQRSTILAVDNLNGVSILGRLIAVDHVSEYKRSTASAKATPMEQQQQQIDAEERRRQILPKHLVQVLFPHCHVALSVPLTNTFTKDSSNAAHNTSSASDSDQSDHSAKALDPMRDYLKAKKDKKKKHKKKHKKSGSSSSKKHKRTHGDD
jgi:RNA-binding motif X-linked protein 2